MAEPLLQTGFPKGNLEQYATILRSQVPRVASLLFRTIDPLVCACLIDLLGNNTRFRKTAGMITPRQTPKGNSFDIRLIYSVPDFVGFNGGEEPIREDQTYILSRLRQIPGIVWPDTAVRILPNDGTVTVMFNIPVGA